MFQTNPSRTKKKQPLERHHKTSRGEIQLSARISSSNVLCWHYKGTTVYIGKVQCLLCQEGLHDPWCGAKTRHRLFLVFFFFRLVPPKNQDIGIKNTWICRRVFIFSFSTKHVFTQLGEKSCFHWLKGAMIII